MCYGIGGLLIFIVVIIAVVFFIICCIGSYKCYQRYSGTQQAETPDSERQGLLSQSASPDSVHDGNHRNSVASSRSNRSGRTVDQQGKDGAAANGRGGKHECMSGYRAAMNIYSIIMVYTNTVIENL